MLTFWCLFFCGVEVDVIQERPSRGTLMAARGMNEKKRLTCGTISMEYIIIPRSTVIFRAFFFLPRENADTRRHLKPPSQKYLVQYQLRRMYLQGFISYVHGYFCLLRHTKRCYAICKKGYSYRILSCPILSFPNYSLSHLP